jgi:hypothetical protein
MRARSKVVSTSHRPLRRDISRTALGQVAGFSMRLVHPNVWKSTKGSHQGIFCLGCELA